jgi:hypothetical protein
VTSCPVPAAGLPFEQSASRRATPASLFPSGRSAPLLLNEVFD